MNNQLTDRKECLIVAEIGINANGDIDIVKKMIDVAVEGKCDFVKLQKRNVSLVYDEVFLSLPRESPWGTTQREQKEGLEFGVEEYKEIDSYCKEKGIQWYASPWDVDSVCFLAERNVPYMKVASALITNIKMLREIQNSQIPIIVSCGMSTREEIDKCLSILGGQVEYLLSCTSSYPTPINEMNMQRIITLQRMYDDKYKIGFSNHFRSIQFIFQAYIMGCEMIEFHITLDRAMYGSDQSASIEPPGVYRIRDYFDSIKQGWGDGNLGCQKSEVSIKAKLRNE